MIEEVTKWLKSDGFVIFLFHGVIRSQNFAVRNYTRKHMLLNRFVEILTCLRRHGNPVSIPQICAAIEHKEELPKRAFAITFDDGFANNARIAAPLLVDFGFPAAFYLTTSFIDSQESSWIDKIEYAFEVIPHFNLRLSNWGLEAAITSSQQKIDLLEQIRAWVKNDPQVNPNELVDEIWKQLGVIRLEPHEELDKKMTWNEVKKLAQEKLFTIGGHSHSHRILSFLPKLELEREIKTSLTLLRTHMGTEIHHYSYPEGLAHCYNEAVIQTLKENGVVCSPTAMEGINNIGDDLFHLKRVMLN